ncbi:Hypothetical predicted protein [Paramuricea clavata]|uniref:Uncharacterized protein n=1 Tax=Paramuricea clavata TaxID=317549 RepID=A0A6S7GGZ1_PARCT|nr:Hypothetical predicted protein [Paramuricea clavata]
MGFLHSKLSKDCDQAIAGLFPDDEGYDEGYAEALMLLRAPIDIVSQENLSLKFQSFVDRARSHLTVLRRYCKVESPFVSSLIYELTDKLPQDEAKTWRTKGNLAPGLELEGDPIEAHYHLATLIVTIDEETGDLRSQSRKSSQVFKLQWKPPNPNLKAWSLESICQPIETGPWPNIKTNWRHLEKLDLRTVGGEVDILLGLDNTDLLVPLEVKTGRPKEPVAKKTSLGWTAVGPIAGSDSRPRVHHVPRADTEPLDAAFKRFWESESFGTKPTNEPIYSKDEKRAIDLLEHGTVKLETGYQVPLLWKENEPRLQNNRQVALKRLEGLERRFERDPEYKNDYPKAIGKYVENGYAVKVNENDNVNGPDKWYLPYHGIYKKSGTEKKLRVVFDVAAKYNGKSLNDALLPGPILQKELPNVLTKLREGDIGFGADSEAMFSRIRPREEDATYHRFIWREKDSDKVDTYQMNRLAFGDTSSPCEAIYITRRTAANFGIGKEKVIKSIEENLKWISNSPEVTAALGNDQVDSEQEGNVANLANHEPETKILGVKWNTLSDELTFSVTPIEDVTYTRRDLLSKLAGLFDPVGFCFSYTIKAKILTQQLCVLRLDWDDAIPPSQLSKWKDWLSKPPEVEKIKIPLCIQPRKAEVKSSELHTFCDALEEAFSAVVYLRSLYADGNVLCSMIMAKTKVAPKKALSVARHELQVALLCARLATYVRKALTRPINCLVFWTDSKCVIGWVRCTAVWYKLFVAHRIGEFQTLTDLKSWCHVPGRLNVSDYATRSGFDGKTEIIPERWFTGPAFLYQSEDHWP